MWPWSFAQHLPRLAFSWHPPSSTSSPPSHSAFFAPPHLPPICVWLAERTAASDCGKACLTSKFGHMSGVFFLPLQQLDFVRSLLGQPCVVGLEDFQFHYRRRTRRASMWGILPYGCWRGRHQEVGTCCSSSLEGEGRQCSETAGFKEIDFGAVQHCQGWGGVDHNCHGQILCVKGSNAFSSHFIIT